MIEGKKPNMLEKWWVDRVGVILNCLFVSWVSSKAMRRPVIVTIRAASLSVMGMDITGVLLGIKLEVISNPAMMLPHASRLMGLMTVGLFSLIGDRGLNRGKPMLTKNTTRRL